MRLTVILPICLVACTGLSLNKDGTPVATDTDAGDWWTAGDTTDGTASTDGTSDIEGDDDDDDTGFEDEGPFLGLGYWASGTLDGNTFAGEGELFGGSASGECVLIFQISTVGPATGCTSCTTQLELKFEDMESEATEGCAELGVDPATVEGSTFKAGFTGGETFWYDLGSGWSSDNGWSEAGEEGPNTVEFEIILSGGEDDEGDDDEDGEDEGGGDEDGE